MLEFYVNEPLRVRIAARDPQNDRGFRRIGGLAKRREYSKRAGERGSGAHDRPHDFARLMTSTSPGGLGG